MTDQPKEDRGITAIAVSGFKSLRDESRIEIRNLTVLAGANSSGKSSIMQPLLLLKQTSDDDRFDSGVLKLLGANVQFTSIRQFLIELRQGSFKDLVVSIGWNDSDSFQVELRNSTEFSAIEIIKAIYTIDGSTITIKPDMSETEIVEQIPSEMLQFLERIEKSTQAKLGWRVVRNRYYLDFKLYDLEEQWHFDPGISTYPGSNRYEQGIRELLHVPGLRGNPEREYRATTAVGPNFIGTFQDYTAAVIRSWSENDLPRLNMLRQSLIDLELTSEIIASPLNNTYLEIRVGRTRQSSVSDMVSIADVGFGVSQVLPVLVALLVAKRGQLVYIEQPELHLHPRAQVKLAEIIADAANRGVRVVIETHSELLLLGIQTAVAEGTVTKDKVILHWFKRDDEGVTRITSGELDENGAYGDWPQDFDTVEFDADGQYLDAIAKRRIRN